MADAGKAVRLAADTDHLYFTTADQAGRVVMVDKATGATTDLATAQALASQVVVDGDDLYWGVEVGATTVVRSVKTDGSGQRDIGSAINATVYDIAVDDSRIYALGTSGLVSIDKATGVPATLTSAANGIGANLAQDAANLYWSSRNDNTIMTVAKTGGGPLTLATNQPVPSRLAVTADGTVYWACRGATGDGSTTLGALHELPAATTDVVEVANNLDHAIEPTLLSHAVLWTVYGPTGTTANAGGSVMAAPL